MIRTMTKPSKAALTSNQQRYVYARGISQFGTELSLVSVAFAVLSFSPSALSLGLVLGARTLPAIVFLLIGGALADKYPNKPMLVGSDAFAFVTQSALAAVLLLEIHWLPLIIVLQTCLGCSTSLFRPTAASTVNRISTQAERLALNARVSVVENFGSLAGPVAGGLLVMGPLGPAGTIAFDGLTYLVSALLLLRLTIPSHEGGEAASRSAASNLAIGWRYVRSQPWMLGGIVQFLVFQAAFAAFFTLGPLLSMQRENGTAQWGVIVTGFGAGALLGSIAVNKIRVGRYVVGMQIALAAAIPSVLVLAYSSSLATIVVTTAVAAAGFSIADVYWDTILQNRTPGDNIGSVFAICMVGSSTLRPFGYLLAGSIAAAIGAQTTLLATALALTAIVVLVAPIVSVSEARRADLVEEVIE